MRVELRSWKFSGVSLARLFLWFIATVFGWNQIGRA